MMVSMDEPRADDNEVGVEAAGPSPDALDAEAEAKRIRLEAEVIREDWRERDGDGE